MSLWILVYVISGFEGYQGNSPVATSSIVFHSQEACEKAAQHFKKGFCLEDPLPAETKVEGK